MKITTKKSPKKHKLNKNYTKPLILILVILVSAVGGWIVYNSFAQTDETQTQIDTIYKTQGLFYANPTTYEGKRPVTKDLAQVDVNALSIPTKNGFFAAYQADHGDEGGVYIGFQRLNAPGGFDALGRKIAVFSAFGEGHSVKAYADGGQLLDKADYEDGVSTAVNFNWSPGTTYRLKMERVYDTTWRGSIINTKTNEETYISTIELNPDQPSDLRPVSTFYELIYDKGRPFSCDDLEYQGILVSDYRMDNGPRHNMYAHVADQAQCENKFRIATSASEILFELDGKNKHFSKTLDIGVNFASDCLAMDTCYNGDGLKTLAGPKPDKYDRGCKPSQNLPLCAPSGYKDGQKYAARFRNPNDVAVGHKYLYVADTGNNAVRRVNLTNGNTDTCIKDHPGMFSPVFIDTDDDDSLIVVAYQDSQLKTQNIFSMSCAGTPKLIGQDLHNAGGVSFIDSVNFLAVIGNDAFGKGESGGIYVLKTNESYVGSNELPEPQAEWGYGTIIASGVGDIKRVSGTFYVGYGHALWKGSLTGDDKYNYTKLYDGVQGYFELSSEGVLRSFGANCPDWGHGIEHRFLDATGSIQSNVVVGDNYAIWAGGYEDSSEAYKPGYVCTPRGMDQSQYLYDRYYFADSENHSIRTFNYAGP